MPEFKFMECTICKRMRATKDGICEKCNKTIDNNTFTNNMFINNIFGDVFNKGDNNNGK